MGFLWHLRGSVPLDGKVADDAILDRLERMLNQQRKDPVERGSDYVAFASSLWSRPFAPSWQAMAIYDQGWFWIDRRSDRALLRYRLRSLELFIFCLCAAFFFFMAGSGGGGFLFGLKMGAGFFAWLYGMNVLLALLRVPSLVERSIAPS